MTRLIAAAALASMLLAVAGPHARSAIAGLRNEFAAVDALAAPAASPQSRARQPRWVPVSDYTAALACEQAREAHNKFCPPQAYGVHHY